MSSPMYFGVMFCPLSHHMSSSMLSKPAGFFNLPTHASLSQCWPDSGISSIIDFLLAHCDPKSVKQALQDPNWLSAMQQEYDALIKNHTCDLVSSTPDRKPIGCKWVFRVKENADGSINM